MPTDTTLLDAMPIVAIIRGVEPSKAVDVANALYDAGIRAVEVPMNSPSPFISIERIASALGAKCLCGGGTVLTPEDVGRVHDAGGRIVVAPNTDVRVIRAAVERGMIAMPGFATATEAFTAIGAGATRLKLFPASSYGPDHLRALKAVLPREVRVYAVGGAGADNAREWIEAGAAGFGVGTELFRPAYTLEEIGTRARRLVEAVRSALPD